jgi:hypothetical protein
VAGCVNISDEPRAIAPSAPNRQIDFSIVVSFWLDPARPDIRTRIRPDDASSEEGI